MQLRDKGSDRTYHVPQEVGAKIVAAGLADEVKEVQPKKPEPNLKFWVQPGARVEDFEYPPLLRFSCGACKLMLGHTESWVGTAHETTVVRHCGLVEKCPPDVAAEYLRLFKQWRSKSRRTSPPVPPISASSPVKDIHAAGLKTSDELRQEWQKSTNDARKFAVRTV